MRDLINWYGNLAYGQGYSGSSLEIVKALDQLRDVRVIGYTDDFTPRRCDRDLDEVGRNILAKPFQLGKIGISYGFPNSFTSIVNEVKVGFTMFETDTLPTGKSPWAGEDGDPIKITNQLNVLFVPCQHNKELFRRLGTHVPIYVVPLGVNTDEKPLFQTKRKRNASKPFRFLFCGTFNQRKGADLVLRAFRAAFDSRKDVELVMKINEQTMKWQFGGINVRLITDYLSFDDLKKEYYKADAFVFPSRGEGFGLTPLEAMYQGVPTIVSDNTGMSEYAQSGYCISIPTVGMSKAVGYPRDWGNVGNWYEPDYAALVAAMKDVFERRSAYNQMAVSASHWVSTHFSYKNTAQRIDEIVSQL